MSTHLLATHGHYEEAKPLCKHSLAIHEKLLGLEHPNVASALVNLALLLPEQVSIDMMEVSIVPRWLL